MSEWAAKRFWRDVSIVEEEGGLAVRLDTRPVRTPGKRALTLPTRAMAERIAAEWDAQEGVIDPRTMPWTRSANTAIDKVALEADAVRDHLIDYAGTDLLSYRAEGPEALIARQAEAWDAHLDWIAESFGARLAVTSGVMPVMQDARALSRLRAEMEPMSAFQLTAFHDLVALTGSFVLGLAAARKAAPAERIWAHSRIDEDFQIEEWGADEEASEVAERKKTDFLHATEFYDAAHG